MTKKSKPTPTLSSLEQERQEILLAADKQIPNDIKKAIEQVRKLSALHEPCVKDEIQHNGTSS